MMIPEQVKAEIETKKQKLVALRDDIKVRLHLASLDAKKEWDEKLSPKLLGIEDAANQITESSRSTLNELISKAEDFLARLKTMTNKSSSGQSGQDKDQPAPPSVH